MKEGSRDPRGLALLGSSVEMISLDLKNAKNASTKKDFYISPAGLAATGQLLRGQQPAAISYVLRIGSLYFLHLLYFASSTTYARAFGNEQPSRLTVLLRCRFFGFAIYQTLRHHRRTGSDPSCPRGGRSEALRWAAFLGEMSLCPFVTCAWSSRVSFLCIGFRPNFSSSIFLPRPCLYLSSSPFDVLEFSEASRRERGSCLVLMAKRSDDDGRRACEISPYPHCP